MNLIKLKTSEKVDRKNLVYRTNEWTYNFKNFRTINTFGRDISNGTITLKEADKDQSDLLIENLNFRKQIRPHTPEKKKTHSQKLIYTSLMVEKELLMLLKVKYFQ